MRWVSAWAFLLGWMLGLGCPPLEASAGSGLEQETFGLINDYRKAHDLAPLTWNEEVAKVAPRA